MTQIGPTEVGFTVLVVVTLVVGGAVAELTFAGQGPPGLTDTDRQHPDSSTATPADDGPQPALEDGEVGLELRPTGQTVGPGGNATYDVVVTGPDTGISAYSFNVTIGNPGVAAITNFTLDRDGFFDRSFITGDNATLALDVGLGDQQYNPAAEVTIATVSVDAVGSPDDSTVIEPAYEPQDSVLANDDSLYTVVEDQSTTLEIDAPPEFVVSNLEPADASVAEGNTVNISADVENLGGQATQTVTLSIDGYSESTNVTLANGENQTVPFENVDTGALGTGEYEHTVSSANDTVSGDLTVLSPSAFAVEVLETNIPVTGENLTVTAAVENVGGTEATQTISLDAGGLGGASTNVTLGGGNATQETFVVETGAGDAGNYTATVSSADDTASANVTVLAAANFTVDIVSTTTPVAGEALNVTASIENVGDVEATQTVDLAVGALGSDGTAVTLDGGNSTTETLGVATEAGDAGSYTATVSSADDTASANVTVLTPANFTVAVTNTTTPVEGEDLDVTVQVANVGDVTDTQTVELDAGTLGGSETNVTLAGGNTTAETLSVGTVVGDAGEYTATVASADDQTSTNVTVEASVEFTVDIVGTTTPAEGEDLDVTVEVTNVGAAEATQTVELDAGALGSDETNVTLGGGNTTEETLSVATEAGDAGAYTATVSSADDTATANVTVLEAAEFTVDIVETSEAVEGEQLNVTVGLENVGEVTATQTLGLDVGSLGNAETNVTLAGGSTAEETLSVSTGAGDAGEYTATVSSADETATANVTVLAPPVFVIESVGTNAPVVAGEELVVTVAVENVGEAVGERLLQVAVGALGANDTTVDLAGGESTEVAFTFDSATEQTGTYNVTVDVGDETAASVVELSPSPLPGNDAIPQDPNGDGRYEDVDGDGAFDIFDVQAFFGSFTSEVVQQHVPAFDFDSSGSVDIFDVQSLFNQLSG